MATIELTKENLADTIENNEIVLIDFWAPWCEPCKTFEPIFQKASDKHVDITFGKVDTDEQPEVASALGVDSIPTFMVFREQIGLLAQPGGITEAGLDSVIEQVKDLDMEEVRAEIAKHEAEHGAEHAHGGGCGCSCNGEKEEE